MGQFEPLTDKLVDDITVTHGTSDIVEEHGPIFERDEHPWGKWQRIRNDVLTVDRPKGEGSNLCTKY